MGKRRKISNYKLMDNYSHYIPGAVDLLVLICWFILGMILGNVASLACIKIFGNEAGMEYGMLVSYPLMFIPAMLYASFKSGKMSDYEAGVKLDNSHFKPVGGLLCALIAMAGTVSASFVADKFISLLPPMPDWLKTVMESMTSGNIVISFILVSIFAPLFEEWLCRGMVLRGLLNYRKPNGKGIKPVWAIIISAIFFAVIHANPWQAIAAFMLGCLFGYVYYKTGSLKLTMLMHFTNNTTALALNQIPSLKEMESWLEVMDGNTYMVVFACCIIILALVVLTFRKIPLQQRQGNFDEVPATFE